MNKINQKRLVNEFIKLVKISSESGEEKEIIQYLKKELQKLGFKTYIDKVGNLIARNSEKPKLILSAHTDTVKPGKNIKPIITKSGVIKTDGTTILGADNKAGVAAILEVLKNVKENRFNAKLEIVFTVSEEPGLVGSSNLDAKKLKAKQVIIVESFGVGKIILGEPSIMYFDIKIKGKAAHSGTDPEKGISAIQIVSEAISRLKWGAIDKESTANVGKIQGGTARNVIPEEARIEAEIRSKNNKKFKKHCRKLIGEFKKAAKEFRGKANIENVQRGFSYNLRKSDNLILAIAKAYKDNKVNFQYKKTRGATDANVFNRKGFKIATFNVGGNDIHTIKETIKIKDLISGTKVLYDVVLELAGSSHKNYN